MRISWSRVKDMEEGARRVRRERGLLSGRREGGGKQERGKLAWSMVGGRRREERG